MPSSRTSHSIHRSSPCRGADLAGDLHGELLAAAGAEVGGPAGGRGGGEGGQDLVVQPADEGVDLYFPVVVAYLHGECRLV
jgi:hypothetical protein